MHQSRRGGGSSDSVQTVQGQQRLRPLQADGRPTQQEGEQPEQEQPLCSGTHTRKKREEEEEAAAVKL